MIPVGSIVIPKDPFMANLHGRLWVRQISEEQGRKKNEAWYQCVPEGELYYEEPDEHNGDELVSAGGDNAITFGENELEVVMTPAL